MVGLGKDWGKIVFTLRELISVYEKGNEMLSLGRAKGLRMEAVSKLRGSGVLLDIGCGPGYMSFYAINSGWKGEILLVDPLLEMLKEARKRVSGHLIAAVAEHLPLRSNCVDAWVAGFSFRDAMDREEALKEMTRVLKQEGEGVLLDLSKPESPLNRFFIRLYWTVSPYLLALRMGKLGLAYRGILLTYKKLPKLNKFLEPFHRFYGKVLYTTRFLGGVMMLYVSDPKPPEF